MSEIKLLLSSLDSFSLTFINSCRPSTLLAKLALSNSKTSVWLGSGPIPVVDACNLDLPSVRAE